MFAHLHILYFFLTFLVGSISLVIATFIYLRTKDDLIRHYLYFYLIYTLMIFLGLFDLYTQVNYPDFPPVLEHSLGYFLEYIILYSLMFVIPFFMHFLFSIPLPKRKNKILGGIILVAYIGQHFTETIGGSVDSLGDIFEDLLFVSLILYSAVLGTINYGKITDGIIKKFAFYFLLLLWIYTPGLIADTLFTDFFPLEFYPMLYCCYSIIYTYLLIKNQTGFSSKAVPVEVTPEFIEKNNISSREYDVMDLILQGKSNKQIALKLFISQSTVKTHISNLYSKCNVKSRYELIVKLSKAIV